LARSTAMRAGLTRLAAVLALGCVLTACVAYPALGVRTAGAPGGAAPSSQAREPAQSVEVLQRGRATRPEEPDQPYAPTPLAEATVEEIAALLPMERPIEATLPPQPLPQFIDTVFGQLIGVPYYTGPSIAERRDYVTLRGAVSMTNRQFFAAVQGALRQYGVAVQIEHGAVRLVEDPVLANNAPLFVRARALPETPQASRPVMQFFELSAVDVGSMMTLLNESYPRRGAVTFTPRPDLNTLVISGNARDVAAAAAVVSELDQPRFASGQIARIRPVYFSAEGFADAVSDAMRTEGYRVHDESQTEPSAIVFLPVPLTNDVLLFSASAAAFERALYWVDQLDRPAAVGDQESVFVYQVENTSAGELAQLLDEGSPAASSAPTRRTLDRPAPPAAPGANAAPAAPAAQGRISVDAAGNRIIFRGTASQFAQLRDLMTALDTPVSQVLVELTVAEVTLTDETRFGVEWYLQQTIGTAQVSFDTRGGSSPEDGGLGASYARSFSRGSVQAALNAIATNRNLNILSTPRLVTRSGSEAQILIGTDVPIITSQRASDNQTGGDTDILQSVQYRQTGVILNVRPVAYGDRVDIEIFQEVSSQQPNDTSEIDSPLILNRSVTTQLSLREGTTGVIGGIMQDSYSRTQTGVPLLKDIPVVGAAFRSDGVSGTKVELVILVTPYILRSDDDMAAMANAYGGALNRLMRRRGPQTYTLLPWRYPFQPRRAHGPLARTAPTAATAAPAPEPAAQTIAAPAPEGPAAAVTTEATAPEPTAEGDAAAPSEPLPLVTAPAW